MKQEPEISCKVAVAAAEHAYCHVLLQLNSSLRQHVLRYVREQSRTRRAFVKSANEFRIGVAGVSDRVVESRESCDERHVRLDKRISERFVDMTKGRVVLLKQLVDAVENGNVKTTHVAEGH